MRRFVCSALGTAFIIIFIVQLIAQTVALITGHSWFLFGKDIGIAANSILIGVTFAVGFGMLALSSQFNWKLTPEELADKINRDPDYKPEDHYIIYPVWPKPEWWPSMFKPDPITLAE